VSGWAKTEIIPTYLSCRQQELDVDELRAAAVPKWTCDGLLDHITELIVEDNLVRERVFVAWQPH